MSKKDEEVRAELRSIADDLHDAVHSSPHDGSNETAIRNMMEAFLRGMARLVRVIADIA